MTRTGQCVRHLVTAALATIVLGCQEGAPASSRPVDNGDATASKTSTDQADGEKAPASPKANTSTVNSVTPPAAAPNKSSVVTGLIAKDVSLDDLAPLTSADRQLVVTEKWRQQGRTAEQAKSAAAIVDDMVTHRSDQGAVLKGAQSVLALMAPTPGGAKGAPAAASLVDGTGLQAAISRTVQAAINGNYTALASAITQIVTSSIGL